MTTTQARELPAAVLHCLRVKGRATTSGIAAALAADETAVAGQLEAYAADGLVRLHSGRLAGWTLTASGRQRHGTLLAGQLRAAPGDRRLHELYQARFPRLNVEVKTLCATAAPAARPGTGGSGGSGAAGDQIGPALGLIHAEALDLLAAMAEVMPRLGRYAERLTAANEQVRAGRLEYLAQPFLGSYHDVWMELHEDLLLTLDRPREAE